MSADNLTALGERLAKQTADAFRAEELQNMPPVTTTYARLVALFEALWDVPGHVDTTLMEFSTPGASQALRDWAAMRGFEVTERIITPPGVSPFRIVKVTAQKSKLTSMIVCVQGAREVES